MAAIHPIYEFKDYRKYLIETLDSEKLGRGARRRLAEYLGCQPSFISQVLKEKNEISLEHAYKINDFLNHSEDEKHFFMSLVLLSKAGSTELQTYYKDLIKDLKGKQLQISKVVHRQEIRDQDALYYYSNWLCVSIHMLVSVPKYQDIKNMKAKLGAEEREFDQALSFLKNSGLVVEKQGKLSTGAAHIHLKKGSVFAQAASVIMRLKTLEMLNLEHSKDLNYSLAFTLSEGALDTLRTKILDLIGELGPMIEGEDPEKFCTLILDLIEH